jgi:hypothetical protein
VAGINCELGNRLSSNVTSKYLESRVSAFLEKFKSKLFISSGQKNDIDFYNKTTAFVDFQTKTTSAVPNMATLLTKWL